MAQLCVLLLDDRAHLKEAALVIGDDALAFANLFNDFKLFGALGLTFVLELLDDYELVLDDLLECFEAQRG